MPAVKPFKAIRYNKEKIRDISRVVAPPYDVIPKKLQDELYRSNPHNIVRLTLNRITSGDTPRNNRYTRSKKLFDLWLAEKILIQEDTDSFYIYSQKYKHGNRFTEQVGFIGLMGLDRNGKDKVLPHENTLAAPKKDRLNLTRALSADLEPIFVLYDDSPVTKFLKKYRAAHKTIIDLTAEGVRHRVWKMDDPEAIKMIEDHMKGKNVFIADGHHRYEAAKIYAKEAHESPLPFRNKERPGYMMVYFVEADEKTLTVLPTHRLVKKLGKIKKDGIIGELNKFFRVEKTPSFKSMMAGLGSLTEARAFGVYLGKGNFYILKLEDTAAADMAIKDKPEDWKRLDVSILHLFVFQHTLGIRDADDNIEFTKDPFDAARAVDSGKFKAAFFLNPTGVSQIKRIAKLGERMPRKSTYFYPKQLSGLVINKY
ncbi:MAG: DUF1015 domain-containing protein [Candidatus Omnitrophota bacterium]|nr:DUF1015 domain-containing protein [Candidatus Omnitrophota bacterium]